MLPSEFKANVRVKPEKLHFIAQAFNHYDLPQFIDITGCYEVFKVTAPDAFKIHWV